MPSPQAGSVQALSDGVTETLPGTWSLAGLEGFPYNDWASLDEKYRQETDWYSGVTLDEAMNVDNKPVEKYPVHVNPIPGICAKHNFALWGDFQDDTRPLVYPKFYPAMRSTTDGEEISDSDKSLIKQAEEVINYLWWENSGRAVQFRAGMLSQIYGGFAFMLRWVPSDLSRTVPIQVELIDPRHFVAFPIPGDEYKLQELWIIKPVDYKTAEKYGIPNTTQGQPYYWIEHWTAATYEVKINDKPVVYPDDPSRPSSGKNEWGFIPCVYIPHTRAANFYGQNCFDTFTGTVKEYNLRIADFGDAVSVDAHNIGWTANTQGQLRVLKPVEGLTLIDAGNNASITGSEQEPRIELLKTGAASQPMKDLVEELYLQIRRDSFVPAVADGEDEGSQRSGETLVARMWPLISHTKGERVNWSSGMDILTRYMLTMLAIKKVLGITINHVKDLKCRQVWPAQLPKDREATVNEAVNRMSVNLGSPELLLQILGDSEDITETIAQMKEWVKYLEDTKADAQAKVFAQKQASFGGQASKGSSNMSGANA
jgi:hypothetical protein